MNQSITRNKKARKLNTSGKKPKGFGSGVFLSVSKDRSVGMFSLENMNW